MLEGTRDETRTGLVALESVTALLQANRRAHPTAGLWEAADLQSWWRMERATDRLPQRFWFSSAGDPVAAVIATDWGDRVSLIPIALPGLDEASWAAVMDQGLSHAAGLGLDRVELEVAEDDVVLRGFLEDRGFDPVPGETIAETWLEVDDRPPVSALTDGHRLLSRAVDPSPVHHNVRSGPAIETRLRQTSLYRPDLDLVVRTDAGDVAAYGLFWFDPTTRTGLVEPMRTNDDHQRRGLARHVLTSGIQALAERGARRIKICYDLDNPASGPLYRSVGFVPFRSTVLFRGPTGGAISSR